MAPARLFDSIEDSSENGIIGYMSISRKPNKASSPTSVVSEKSELHSTKDDPEHCQVHDIESTQFTESDRILKQSLSCDDSSQESLAARHQSLPCSLWDAIPSTIFGTSHLPLSRTVRFSALGRTRSDAALASFQPDAERLRPNFSAKLLEVAPDPFVMQVDPLLQQIQWNTSIGIGKSGHHESRAKNESLQEHQEPASASGVSDDPLVNGSQCSDPFLSEASRLVGGRLTLPKGNFLDEAAHSAHEDEEGSSRSKGPEKCCLDPSCTIS